MPNLRFPGFEGEWERKKLGEVAEIFKGKGISKEQLSLEGIPCILYGELYTKYKSEIISEVISRTNINEFGLVKSKSNDVIIPASGETAIDISTARCVVYDDVLLGGDLNILRLKNDNGVFLSYQINGRRKFDIAKLAQGISVVHLYGERIKTLNVYFPNIAEQTQIASFLSLIDERIATQMKTIEEWRILRKGYWKAIYSNYECREYRMGEIAEIGRGRVISTTEINNQNNPKYPVYSSQTSNDGIMGYLDTFDFEGEFITWTTDGANAGTVFYRNGKFNCTNVCGTIKLKTNHNPYFVAESLQQETKKYVSINLANPKLMNNVMSSIKIELPDIKVQNKISFLFQSIDKKINLEKSLLIAYQQQKKYLLQNLFI